MKVMIVDDSKTARLFVRKTLLMAIGSNDVEVIEAESGEVAFQTLCKDPHFDLLLSDVNMPVMSGFTFMHNLRLNKKLSQIPVVFVTSLSNASNQHNLLELGAYAVISKPISVSALQDVLTRLQLKQKHESSEWGG